MDEPQDRRYVARFVDDGELRVWLAGSVADALSHQAYADGGDFTLHTWTGQTFEEVTIRRKSGPFDVDDYADVSVELVAPDGAVLDVTGYRVDGRA